MYPGFCPATSFICLILTPIPHPVALQGNPLTSTPPMKLKQLHWKKASTMSTTEGTVWSRAEKLDTNKETKEEIQEGCQEDTQKYTELQTLFLVRN